MNAFHAILERVAFMKSIESIAVLDCPMNIDEILNVAEYAGRILLESGAEAYRAEETMVKICESFCVDEAQSYVTTTGIMISITHQHKNYTKIARIQTRGVNLYKIDAINQLSRNIRQEHLSIEHVKETLEQIDHEPRYSYQMTLFFSALSAFGFALFFHGTLLDASCAFFIGLIIKFVSIGMERNDINAFFNHAISGGVAALLALFMHSYHMMDSMDTVIISSIMLLVPGLAITNAIRDTVAGDYLAGVARGAEAFLIAIAIAIGIGAVLSMWMQMNGGL